MQLSKDIIVDSALEILDTYGLQDLTIRRLARHLDAAAGAMYWHFPSKQALLGAVADRMLAPLAESDKNSLPDALALHFHTLLTNHRDGAEVVSAALATGTATIRPEEIIAEALGDETAADVVTFFILGATVEEQTAQQLAEANADAQQKSPKPDRIGRGVELILSRYN